MHAELGVRLRQPLDFAGFYLGNQGFFAFGVALDLLQPDWLSVARRCSGCLPLSDNRGSAASPLVSEARLFPAEWLASLHSSFGSRGPWRLSLGAGSGISTVQ